MPIRRGERSGEARNTGLTASGGRLPSLAHSNRPDVLSPLEHLTLLMRESVVVGSTGRNVHDLVGAAVREGDPATQILQFARSAQADA